jgi:hypothetical protein
MSATWPPEGKIRLMPDEHPIGVRIEGEQPPIAVGAVVNLSGPNSHAKLLRDPRLQVGISPLNGTAARLRALGSVPSWVSSCWTSAARREGNGRCESVVLGLEALPDC